ncbi:MAG: hypothetical protein JSS07_01270 [Proteobacteria bacterium]|nr:hypothetical protein [Pseudomonadota bacterium]
MLKVLAKMRLKCPKSIIFYFYLTFQLKTIQAMNLVIFATYAKKPPPAEPLIQTRSDQTWQLITFIASPNVQVIHDIHFELA